MRSSSMTYTMTKAVAIFTMALLLGAGLLAAPSTALAVPLPLPPGGSVVPTQAALPPVGAINVAHTSQNFLSQDSPLNPDGTSYTGTLVSDVWMNYPGNPLGGLTFTYQLINNGPDRLHRLATTDFTGYQTDVEYDALTVPGMAPVTADRLISGDAVGWDFGNNPGLLGSTARLIIDTNATQFTPALASTINAATASALSYGPTPIPEPAALGCAILAGSVLLNRRRTSR